ncbi:hypothetical protein M758_4G153300 [Ceratodon purpureus]|nr:hypothetical protein M758_4G153300 [Ceratodon purpureus]
MAATESCFLFMISLMAAPILSAQAHTHTQLSSMHHSSV